MSMSRYPTSILRCCGTRGSHINNGHGHRLGRGSRMVAVRSQHSLKKQEGVKMAESARLLQTKLASNFYPTACLVLLTSPTLPLPSTSSQCCCGPETVRSPPPQKTGAANRRQANVWGKIRTMEACRLDAKRCTWRAQ